ncbi:hypothetical protein DPMN_125434 [Dreissena polymorpha]|uniref:Uncharacterized protein n=1 Tax=Dreissena polymorpha TaxID=45954 RepID=A0A9D4JUP9_DREPO|nr:hypothetical protein DPMN_125434 [Dreissena polymorpha]
MINGGRGYNLFKKNWGLGGVIMWGRGRGGRGRDAMGSNCEGVVIMWGGNNGSEEGEGGNNMVKQMGRGLVGGYNGGSGRARGGWRGRGMFEKKLAGMGGGGGSGGLMWDGGWGEGGVGVRGGNNMFKKTLGWGYNMGWERGMFKKNGGVEGGLGGGLMWGLSSDNHLTDRPT